MKFIPAKDTTADMIEHEAKTLGLTRAEFLDRVMGIYWLERSEYIK